MLGDLVGDVAGDPAVGHADEEPFPHGGHPGPGPFRAHRLAQPVGFPGGEPGRVDRDLHELLLEERHAEGLAQARFEDRVRVGDGLLAAAAAQVGVHGSAFDRPGADQRHLDDKVVERAGPQAGQGRHLGSALDLEHPDRVGGAEQVVHLVLLGDGGQVDVDALVLTDQVDGEVQGGEHPEAEQVELHETGRGAVVLVPLQDRAVLHAGPLDRAELHERTVGHHHPARVDAEVPRVVEHLAGEVDDQLRDRGAPSDWATSSNAWSRDRHRSIHFVSASA